MYGKNFRIANGFSLCCACRISADGRKLQRILPIFKLALESGAITIRIVMIAQQEIQYLLTLPVAERLQLAQRLIESALREAADWPVAENGETHPGVSAQPPSTEKIIPFRSLEGLYSGGQADTGERADEILRSDIKPLSGFTLKHELPS